MGRFSPFTSHLLAPETLGTQLGCLGISEAFNHTTQWGHHKSLGSWGLQFGLEAALPYEDFGTFRGWSGKLQSIPYRDLYRRLITKPILASGELRATRAKRKRPSKHRTRDKHGLSFL